MQVAWKGMEIYSEQPQRSELGPVLRMTWGPISVQLKKKKMYYTPVCYICLRQFVKEFNVTQEFTDSYAVPYKSIHHL